MPKKSNKHVAVYIRVSTVGQNEAGQRREIERWLHGNGIENVQWYVDKESGDTLKRPAFAKLQKAIFNGEVSTVVVWKLDRLSRKFRDGINIICDWCDRDVRIVATTQQIDFAGTVGKIIAAVLVGIAEMEQQTRKERQRAGIDAALERIRQGKQEHWGGSKPGHKRVTPDKAEIIKHMKEQGKPIAAIARAVGVSRPTVYAVLNHA
jgi:DNA invertase Pin-like site-specific DNA recombinase